MSVCQLKALLGRSSHTAPCRRGRKNRRFPMPAALEQTQLPLCCPCGSGEFYRRGLCEPCYNRGRRSRARFGGGREKVLARDRYLCRVCQALRAARRPPPPARQRPFRTDHPLPDVERVLWLVPVKRLRSGLCPGYARALPLAPLRSLADGGLDQLGNGRAAKARLGSRRGRRDRPRKGKPLSLRVPGARRSGVRPGYWLTLRQVQQLLAEPHPETKKGLGDRVLLGLLVGCWLWRGELPGWFSPMSLNARGERGT